MKQHVIAFLIAIVLWITGNTLWVAVARRAHARIITGEGGRNICQETRTVEQWTDQNCVLTADCNGNCEGMLYAWSYCTHGSDPEGRRCVEEEGPVPLYAFSTPCQWRQEGDRQQCVCDVDDPSTSLRLIGTFPGQRKCLYIRQ